MSHGVGVRGAIQRHILIHRRLVGLRLALLATVCELLASAWAVSAWVLAALACACRLAASDWAALPGPGVGRVGARDIGRGLRVGLLGIGAGRICLGLVIVGAGLFANDRIGQRRGWQPGRPRPPG